MSEYVKHNCKALRNQEILLAALSELGWGGKVEIHKDAQPLYGYHGDQRKERANLIIRRNNTGISSSNDIGFALQADGTYQPIVSQYDSTLAGFGKRAPDGRTNLAQTVEEAYGRIAGNKAVEAILNDVIPGLRDSGAIDYNAMPEVVTVGDETRVQLRY